MEVSKQDFELPVFSPFVPIFVNSKGTEYNPNTQSIHLSLADSQDMERVKNAGLESGQDALFTEFGHFLMYEFFDSAGDSINAALHPKFAIAFKKLTGSWPKPDCHFGYAQQDSSCALNEAKGHFLGSILAERVNYDTPHNYLKNLASNLAYGTLNVDIEKSSHIAGRDGGDPKYIFHKQLAEEIALTSLLWDSV